MSRTIAESQAWAAYEEGRGPMPELKAPLGRHTRKCTVCHHPERKAIEMEFLRWRSAQDIADDYGFRDYTSIYRHARAAGLFERRRANVRMALESIIERAEHARVTAGAVVDAVRTYAQINDSGKWVSTTAHVVHHSLPGARTLPPAAPRRPLPPRIARQRQLPAATRKRSLQPQASSVELLESNRPSAQELESDPNA